MAKNKRVTLQTIADELGISVSVVSRVLNGKSANFQISPTTAEAVRQTAKKLNYTPHLLARGLRMQKTFTLGLILPDISNPFFATLARCIEHCARAEKYSLVIADSQRDCDVEKESLSFFLDRQVDGLIIDAVGASSEHLADIDLRQIPVVLVDRYFPELRIPYVTSDNRGGAHRGTKLLTDKGHRRIGFVQGLPQSSVNRDRLTGYRDALRETGIPLSDDLIKGAEFSRPSGYKAVKELLALHPRPTALFLASNQIAFGAIEALAELQLRVPDDVSLVAFDEHLYSGHLAVPLTTIGQQEGKLAEHALKLLLRQIDNLDSDDPVGVTVPTFMVERPSIRAL